MLSFNITNNDVNSNLVSQSQSDANRLIPITSSRSQLTPQESGSNSTTQKLHSQEQLQQKAITDLLS